MGTAYTGSAPEDAGELARGTVVGEYRIEGTLGAGGMGRVYSAIHPVIAKKAAVKLLDFGIAKLAGPEKITNTRTGNMLGTPAYISPEQARGEGVDHRTDIYALGAMLFELVTGEMVFSATNVADMIGKQLYERPR